MSGPLAGLTVLDLSQLAQGPFATQMLGDMGADVIKVEPPKGDWMRHFAMANAYLNGHSTSFLSLNRNKRSIAIDLKTDAGKEILLGLVEQSDVLIENFRPGVMERLGIGYDRLAEVNPRLVYCASSGYGQDGPYRERPGQDLLVQALTGLTYLNGTADDPPVPVGIGIADLAAGMHIVIGVLSALHHRHVTGKGQRVDVNLLDSILALQAQELVTYLNTGVQPERSANGVPNPFLGAPYGVYRTADGYIALAMNRVDVVARLVGVDGYEDVTSNNVLEGRDDVRSRLAERFLVKTTKEWLDILLAEDVWCAEVNDYSMVVEDPQIRHNQMITSYEHPEAGEVKVLGNPIRFSAAERTPPRPAPLLGGDTKTVLTERLGYSEERVRQLVEQGVVT
jgi:crotonobetainyl-CoA:carnitine CoA-transferase CaiB-like acyl-CoA transferase